MSGALVAVLAAASARAEQGGPAERVGRVRSVEGAAFIVRNGAGVPAAVGEALQRGDVIRTGKPGAVGLVLNDETTIALGSASELALLDFAFAPKDGRFALVVRMAKGTCAYLAGLIGKLAPGAIQLQLPDSTVAVRGTRLLITVGE